MRGVLVVLLVLLGVVRSAKDLVSGRSSSVEGLKTEVEVGSTQEFTIVARDAKGKRVRRGGSIWSVRFVGAVYASPRCITDDGNGGYRVSYSLPQAGEYSVQIELKYQSINTSSDTSCARNRSKVFKMYTACNPKSDYYVDVDGLHGCAKDLESDACVSSTKKYIECMDSVKDICQYPHLVKEPIAVDLRVRANGMGMVSAQTNRACSTRAEAFGSGHWVNISRTCSLDNNWKQLGFYSEEACEDAVYPCTKMRRDGFLDRDLLSNAVCRGTLIWRPDTCFLSPVSRYELESRHRHFFFYGVSTIDEIARRMRDFFKPETIVCLRNIRNSGDIPWHKPNTTFILHACGEQVATTLTLTLSDRQRQRSCQIFTHNLYNLIKKHSTTSRISTIDIIYQRHPVNYPRNAQTPAEIKNAIGRYPGSRGYMSADELLTDFYDDIMLTYTADHVPINGILNQQAMTQSLWGEYGDGLHYDNKALRFVLDSCVLLLANAVVLPSFSAEPVVHDANIGTCPSYFRTQGLYHTHAPSKFNISNSSNPLKQTRRVL